jgi:hypothetical protein
MWMSLSAAAQESTDAQPQPSSSQPDAVIGVIDTPREYLSRKFIGFVSGVDRFFGDDLYQDQINDSVLLLDLDHASGYGGQNRFVLSGWAKVHLPATERNLHLVLESDPDKNPAVDPKQTPPLKQPTTPESYSAALRYEKAQAESWHLTTDAGLKFRGLNTSPFVRARASLGQPLGQWLVRPAETLFWFNSTGAGAATQIDLDRPIDNELLFRTTSNATWLHDQQNFDLRQDLSLYQWLDDRTTLLYQASAIGVSEPNSRVLDYVVLLVYRRRVHRDWVYLELTPQLHFPWERSYRMSSAFSMRLELLFDEAR